MNKKLKHKYDGAVIVKAVEEKTHLILHIAKKDGTLAVLAVPHSFSTWGSFERKPLPEEEYYYNK